MLALVSPKEEKFAKVNSLSSRTMAGDERSLESQIAALPPDVRERILVTSGARAVMAEDTGPPNTDVWGFSNLPKLLDFYKEEDLSSGQAEEEQDGYHALTPGCIVWGRVCACDNSQHKITVDIKAVVAYHLDGVPPKRWRFSDRERVLGQCSLDPKKNELAAREYPAASPVVAIVLQARPGQKQIVLSLRETDIKSYARLFPRRDLEQTGPWLGKGPKEPPAPPNPDVLRKNGATSYVSSISYMEWLQRDPDFQSLHSAPAMQKAYGIQEGWSVSRGWTHRGDKAASASIDRLLTDDIKPATRTAWAIDSTRRGRTYYEKHEYDTAIKLCEQAMELDATHVPTYTLRGAAFAKKRKYGDACRDFRVAIKLDPQNEHAKKYLARIEKEHPQAAGKVSMMGGAGRPRTNSRDDDLKRESPDEAPPSRLSKDTQLERELEAEVQRERERKRARLEKGK